MYLASHDFRPAPRRARPAAGARGVWPLRRTTPRRRPQPPIPGAAMPAADTAARSSALPPVPTVKGPLAIRVVYPTPDAVVRARDSSFLFGSAGTGDAQADDQRPSGAGLAQRRLARLDPAAPRQPHAVPHRRPHRHRLRHARLLCAPGRLGAGARSRVCGSTPRRSRRKGDAWWPADEYLTFSVRASEGAETPARSHRRLQHPAAPGDTPGGDPRGHPRVRPGHGEPGLAGPAGPVRRPCCADGRSAPVRMPFYPLEMK